MKSAFASVAAGAILAMAFHVAQPIGARAQEQEQRQNRGDDQQQQRQPQTHSDYSQNSFYQMGNREGYEDYQGKKQRMKHDHKYRNDEDRAAHDQGYKEGWEGKRYDEDQDRH